MPPDSTAGPISVDLLIFKSARVTAHLLQNLQLLAWPCDEAIETRYGDRWIAADVAARPPRKGETALVALGSSPYRELVPCRLVTIAAVNWNGELCRLAFRLGPFVMADEQLRIARDILAGDSGTRPPRAFLARPVGPLAVRAAAAGDDELAAWRMATQRLANQENYAKAMFARARVGSGPFAPDQPLTVGVELVASKPVVDPTVRLADAELPLELESESLGADHLSLRLTPHAEGVLRASILVVGDEHVTVPLPLQLSVESAPEPTVAPKEPRAEPMPPAGLPPSVAHAEVISLPAAELRRLLRDARRLSGQQLGRRLGERVAEAAPADVEIAAHTAALFAAADRWDEVARLLERFDPAELEESALYERFLADCRTGRLEDAELLLERLDFATDEHFSLLCGALAHLPDATALRLALTLMDSVVDDHRALQLFHALRDRIHQPTDVAAFTERIQLISQHEALHFLAQRTVDAHPSRRELELLADLARELPGSQAIGPQLRLLCDLRLEANDIAGIFELLAIAETDATADERLEIAEAAADALVQTRRSDALELLRRAAEQALRAGRLERAAQLAQRASGVCGSDEASRAVIADLCQSIEAALRETEPLRGVLRMLRQERIRQARSRIGGRTLVLVGGRRNRDVEAELQTTFAFGDIDWHEAEKDKKPEIRSLAQRDVERTIILVITDYIGHASSGAVKQLCETRGMTMLESRGGIGPLVDALLAAFDKG